MKKIAIFSTRNVKSAYSCLLYLKEELEKKYDVALWAFTNTNDVPLKYRKNYHSYVEKWYGKIRRVRLYIAKLIMLTQAKNFDVFIVNDLDFFRVGYIIKKLYPNKIIIHYNTEIHDVDIKYPWHTTNFYNRHANYPDMIIECLKERALYRKQKYSISQEVYTINNTLPAKDIEDYLSKNIDIRKYLAFEEKHPIAIYAGGCNMSRCLGDVIKFSSKFEGQLNFLFFCHGNKNDYDIVINECKNHLNCKVFPAVDKETLFNVMDKCDIGIQYYDPTISVNHLYAAPSKLFEYLAMGLNIVSSNNCGINKIITDNKCGVCFDNNETIYDGLERLLDIGLSDKAFIKNTFRRNYSYEEDSKVALNRIYELLEQ